MANMSSIRKIEDTIFDVKRQVYYVETLEDGTVITDETRELPTVEFKTTVKLHGTFAGVRYKDGVITPLSKTEDLSLEKDNANFAEFVHYNQDHFMLYLKDLADSLGLEEVQLAGEWVGKKIQKGVGINLIERKTYVMFGIKFKKVGEEKHRWAQLPQEILRQISSKEMNIRTIFEFQTNTVQFNFNNPEEAIKKFDAIRDAIEKECPVASAMLKEEGSYDPSVALIGEGLVASGFWNDQHLVFKHKGEKHSKAHKIRQPKEVDPLEAQKLKVADKVTPGWRLNQAVSECVQGQMTSKDIGAVVKWVIQDVKKEEQSILRENNFDFEDIQKFVTKITVDFIQDKLREDALK